MNRESSRLRIAGLAALLLAGGFATVPGPAEAGQGVGSFGGFQGRGMVVGAPAHQGVARTMAAPRPMAPTRTTVPVPPMQSGFLNQGFVPAITPGFDNQGFIPPIAPGFLNEGFIPAIAPGFMNEGFIPPLVASSTVTGHRFGFHRHAFGHRFAFNHRFAFGHRFAFHRHFFEPFAGIGFRDVFFGSPAPAPEIVEPEDFADAGPSAQLGEDEEPFEAHDVRVGSGGRAEASAGSHKGLGKVVVMRPGFQDEVVTVPRDAGGG